MFDLTNCRFAFLDLETTGLSPWFGDRICEVGIVLTEGKRIKGTFETLVNPGRELSPAAASTNGLTDAELATAPPFEAVADELTAHLRDAVVVCHNAQFDLQFLDSEFRRIGREVQIPNLIDTLTIARALRPAVEHAALDCGGLPRADGRLAPRTGRCADRPGHLLRHAGRHPAAQRGTG